MQIQRLVDLEDYEFDTLLVTYNHKNRLSIELGKVSEIFKGLQEDELVGGSKVYGLRTKLNNGEKLSREEKDWLTRNVNSNTYFKSAVPLQGWMFDFSDILRTYIVKQYGHWAEYKATDKTALRSFLYGRIDSIVELNK